MSVVQVWCPTCEAEVIARPSEAEPAHAPCHAPCPWCETTILIPEEAQA